MKCSNFKIKIELENTRKEIKKHASKKQAVNLQRFFKTGKGEYGEGDIFIGVKVPDTRAVAKKFKDLSLKNTLTLLKSKIHEERLLALFILIQKYSSATPELRKKIYTEYLKNTKYINNWDLIDLSAYKIVGEYLIDKSRKPLYKLARSESLWERRIAVLSTFYFIKKNDFADCIKISKMLLKDDQDLIHKAVGWMLREIGKRDIKILETFLKGYYKNMPRTMLRYAIERFPEKKRLEYLRGEA